MRRPNPNEVYPVEDHYRLRVSGRTQNRLKAFVRAEILVLVGVLLVVGVKKWSETSLFATGPAFQAADGNLESTPEVRYATTGEWIAVSGLWSKYGVLGAAFDGERIVLSSSESKYGSVSCWISPRERPMTGACYESSTTPDSQLPDDRTCSWRIIVYEISPTVIRGARLLKAGESNRECASDRPSLPSSFAWERPQGQPTYHRD
jgi:hypothetical protein